MATFENWGDYFWPGQLNECRRNLLGLHDPAELAAEERRHSALRSVEIARGDVDLPRTYDLAHVQAIHRHLFQDVYEWAGQLRVVDLVRPAADPNAPANQFAAPEHIEPLAARLFGELGSPQDLAAASLEERVHRLAQTYSGINVVHPFFDGNGRTNREFLTHAAAAMNCRVDLARFPGQNEVMAQAFTLGHQPVVDALRRCVSDTDAGKAARAAAAAAARFPRQSDPSRGHSPPPPGPQRPGRTDPKRDPGMER